MKKWFIKSVVLVFVMALAASYLLYNRYDNFLKADVFKEFPTTLHIKKGSHFSDFIAQVRSKDGNGEVWQWKLMARLNPEAAYINAGEFEITEPMVPRALVEYIAKNRVKTYPYTLIEGHEWKRIKPALQSYDLKKVLFDMDDAQIMQTLSIDAPSLEGQFLPETYLYVKGDSDLDVLRRAHQDLVEVLNKAWDQRDEDLELKSPYELLILASIIEKETAVHSERGAISGVFHRRLKKGMKLQTDPTVIYGVGDAYSGDITRKHLDTDTPYNTYTRKGLPPTPIAMASRDSIFAAANPEPGTALYFVADGDGGHAFSDTYDQHLEAVKRYLKLKQQ